MSSVLAHCVSGSGAKTGATPLLSGAPALKHYRRSVTNKAPRKRTFIANMTKFDSRQISSAGITNAFANNVGMLSGGYCFDDTPCAYGGDGNNWSNGGNNGGNSNNNGGQGAFGEGAPRLPAILFGQALLGALALTVAVAAFPAHSTAASSLAGASSAAAARPRSKVMHVSTKGGTLVVPLPANSEAKAIAGPFARSKIVEAPIQLTGREAAIIDGRQYRVRESMLVQ